MIQKISDHLQDALRLSLETKYVAVLSLASWEIRSWLEFFTCSMFLVVVVVVVVVVDFQFCLCHVHVSLTLRGSAIR